MLPVIAEVAKSQQTNSTGTTVDEKNTSSNEKPDVQSETSKPKKPLSGVFDMYKAAMGLNKEDHKEVIDTVRHEEITGTLVSVKENTSQTNVLLEELLKKKCCNDDKSGSLLPLLAGMLGKMLSGLLNGLKGLLGAFKLPRIGNRRRTECCCGTMDSPDRDRRNRRDRNRPSNNPNPPDVDIDRRDRGGAPDLSKPPKPKPKPKMGKGKLGLILAAATLAAGGLAATVMGNDDDNSVQPATQPSTDNTNSNLAASSGAGLATLGVAAKMGVKALPGIGLAAGIGFGANRASNGDFTGAGLEVLSGFAALLPGFGTAASLSIQAGLLARDNGVEASGTLASVSSSIMNTTGSLATSVLDSVTSTAIAAKDTTVAVATSLIESGTTAVTNTLQAAQGAIGKVIGVIGNISSRIVGIVGGLASGVLGTISTLGNTITSFASSVWQKIANSDFVNGVKNAAGSVVDTVKGVFNGTAGSNTKAANIQWAKEATPEVFKAINNASTKHGVSEDYMKTMAYIESRGNPNANRGPNSAKGLYQFIPSTAKAYGIQGQELDVNKNADAAAKYALANKNGLRKALGREPEPWELYLAHNQGLGGATSILKNMQAGTDNISSEVRGNMNNQGLGNNLSATQFAGKIRDKYTSYSNGINGTPQPASNNVNNIVTARQQQGAAAKPTQQNISKPTMTTRKFIRAGVSSKTPAENLEVIRKKISENPNYYKGNVVELVTGIHKDPKDTASVAEQIKVLAANGADVRLVKVPEEAGHRAKIAQDLNKTLSTVAAANKSQMITNPFTTATNREVTASVATIAPSTPSITPQQTTPASNTGGSGSSGSTPSSTTTDTTIKPAVSSGSKPEAEGTKPTQQSASDSELIAAGKKATTWGKNAVEKGMNPAFLEKYYAMAGEYANTTKKGIFITEAFRTSARQAELKAQHPNKAAAPGLSMHEYGLAMDIGTGTGNAMASSGLLRKYGFVRPYSNEPWHIEHESTRAQRAALRKNDEATRSKAASLIAGSPIKADAVTGENGMLSGNPVTPDSGGLVETFKESGFTTALFDAAAQSVKNLFNDTPDVYVQSGYSPTSGLDASKNTAGQIKPTQQFKRTPNTNHDELAGVLERFNSGGMRVEGRGDDYIANNPQIFNNEGVSVQQGQQAYTENSSGMYQDTPRGNSVNFSRVVPEQYSGTTFGKSVNFLLDNINNVRNRDYNSLTKSVLGAVGQTDFMKSSPLLSSISNFITGNLDNVENKNYTGLAGNLLTALGSPKTVQPNTGVTTQSVAEFTPTKQPTTTDALLKDIGLVSDITSVLPTSTDDVLKTTEALLTTPVTNSETASMDRFNTQVRDMLGGQTSDSGTDSVVGKVYTSTPTTVPLIGGTVSPMPPENETVLERMVRLTAGQTFGGSSLSKIVSDNGGTISTEIATPLTDTVPLLTMPTATATIDSMDSGADLPLTPNSVMRNVTGLNPTSGLDVTTPLLKDVGLGGAIVGDGTVFENNTATNSETASMDMFNAQVRAMLGGQPQATIGSVSSGVPTSTLSVTPTPSTKPTSFMDKLKSVGSFVNDNLGSIASGDYNTLTGNALSALGGTVNKTPTNIIDRSLSHATNFLTNNSESIKNGDYSSVLNNAITSLGGSTESGVSGILSKAGSFVTNNSESIKNGDYSSVLNNAITSLGGDSNSGFGGILSKAGSFVSNNSESIKNGDYSSVISGIGSFFGSRNKHGQAQPNTTDLVASQDGKPMDIMKHVSGISSAPLTNVGSDLITATPTTDLRQPVESRVFTPTYDSADAMFNKTTSDYAAQANKPPVVINQSPQTNSTVNNSQSKDSAGPGVNAPIRVRNSDSVIRDALTLFMKQTM